MIGSISVIALAYKNGVGFKKARAVKIKAGLRLLLSVKL